MFKSQNYFDIEPKVFRSLLNWRMSTFFVMLIGYIGYYLVRQNLSVALPLMQSALGYTNTELGLIAAISELVYAVGKLINGPLADKLGGRKLFLVGLIGAVLANLLFVMGSSLVWFIVVWSLCRYFLSMGWGGLTKVIGIWFEPEKNGTVMGWISLNYQFGGVVAGALAGLIVSLGGGWKEVFIYPALVASVVWIYSIFASRESPSDILPGTHFGRVPGGKTSVASAEHLTENIAREPAWAIAKHLLSLELFRHLLTFSFLIHILRSVFVIWAPKLLIDIGLGTQKGIFSSLIFPFLGCIGTILLGWYTDRYAKNGDRARMMWILLLGLTITLAFMGKIIGSTPHLNDDSLTLVVALLGLSGFFLYGPYSMGAGALSLDIAGSRAAGTCTGLLDGFGYVGGAIGAYGAGKFSESMGWGGVCLMMSGFAALSTLAAWRMSAGFQRRARKAMLTR